MKTRTVGKSHRNGSLSLPRNRRGAVTRCIAELMEGRVLLSANLVWNPQSGSNVWDYVAPNWLDTATHTPAVFQDGDAVTFNDTGGGGTVSVINTGVSPGSVTDNSSMNYLLQHADINLIDPGINGAGTLTKQGSGTLTLRNLTNGYTGSTDIQAGTLALSSTTLGDGSATVTVESGGSLEILEGAPLLNPLVLNGSGINGAGALVGVADLGGGVGWNGPITAATASTINSGPSLDLAGDIENDAGLTLDGSGLTLLDGAVTGPGGITKIGSGTAVFANAGKTYSGPTEVVAGTLQDGGGASGELSPNSRYTVAVGATLQDEFDTIGSLSGGGTVVSVPGSRLTVGADNSDFTFSGVINGGGIIKIGAGTFTLAGDQPNTFHALDIGAPATGGGAIDGGTVVLDKADRVTAVGGDSPDPGNGITIFSGKLLWAASNQLLPTEQIVGRPEGPADIDLGNHTDSCYSIASGNGGTFHIGTGGTLNIAAFAVTSFPGITWAIDQGANLNLLNGGADFAGFRLAAGDLNLNLAGTINIGNSSGVDAAEFLETTANIAPTARINTGSGAVALVGATVDLQSGAQINVGKYGDGGSLQFRGNIESVFNIEAGGLVTLAGANSTIGEFGGNFDLITGAGNIDLLGGSDTIDCSPGVLGISANIIDGTMTKTGTGPLRLGGNDALEGATTIEKGVIVLGNDSALANTTHIYIDDGGSLELNGHSLDVPIDAAGNGGQFNGGAITNGTGDFYGLSGPGGPATLFGTLTLNDQTAFAGNLPITLAGQVTGAGGISMASGSSSLIFTNADNDYSGGTTNVGRSFGAGSFEVAAPHALGSGSLSMAGGTLTLDSATDQVTASSVALTVGPSGFLPNLIINAPAPSDSYTIINNAGSSPVAGTFNGLPQGASLLVGGKTFYINYKGGDGNDVVITTSPVQNSVQNIQGMVWADFNNDGNVDFGELGIGGVTITLTGSAGNVVATTATDSNGLYTFNNVPADVYSISEGGASAGYVEGKDSLGSITDLQGNLISAGAGNASVQDVFSGVPVGANQNAINYNFGEQPAAGSAVSKGQAATMGFWQNKNGQALINKFATIGSWLAATLPQTFGSLAGATPQQVATLYQQKFVLTDKLDAQVMATALNVYATDSSLGGSFAASYGFAVGTYGLGDSTWNIGSDGAAFNVANNSTLTVMQVLQDWDQQANKTSKSIRQLALDVFGGINAKGGI
jgi:fibronectin-binding autotransporter adhesin